MSNSFFQGAPVAETFVSIYPQVDEAQFKTQTQTQVDEALAGVQADITPALQIDVPKLQQQFRQATEEILRATKEKRAIDQGSFGGDAGLSLLKQFDDLQRNLVATGGNTQLLEAQLAGLTPDFQALTAAGYEYGRMLERTGQAERESGRRKGTLRQQIREVLEGQESVGSLLTGGNILKLGVGTLAFEAVFSSIGHLQDALKVTGEEALTFEGRMRNAGAALLHGDLVEAIGAINEKGPTAEETLKGIAAAAASGAETFKDEYGNVKNIGVAFDEVATKGAKAADELHRLAQAQEDVGDNGALHDAVVQAADDLDKATVKAGALAQAFRTGQQAADDFATSVRQAGSEAARFGERGGLEGRGPGGVERGQPFVGATFTDETATQANQDAISASLAQRQQGLARLRAVADQAEREAREAEALERRQRTVVEGRVARRRAAVEARTKAEQADQAVAAEEKRQRDAGIAAAKKAADEERSYQEAVLQGRLAAAQATEKNLADDRGALEALAAYETEKSRSRDLTKSQRQEAANAAAQYRRDIAALGQKEVEDTLAAREIELKADLDAAKATERTIADDRRALLALARFEHEKSQNRELSLRERRQAAADEKAYRRELSDLNKAQLAEALQVREQNLRNAIEAAKLTPADTDDKAANAAFLKFLQNQVKRAKGDALAVAQAKGDLIAFQLSLQGQRTTGAFDLFAEAGRQFEAFGSNIAGRGGVLSKQDARAAVAADVIQSRLHQVQQAQLTQQERQTQLLTSIDGKIGTVGKTVASAGMAVVSSAGNFGGWRAAREAASNQYGAN